MAGRLAGPRPAARRAPAGRVFAGTHGVAARGVSAYPPEVTEQMVQNFIAGGAAINQLAARDRRRSARLRDGPRPSDRRFHPGPGDERGARARAMAYGMMAVEPGIDVLCLGEMGIANTTAAAALCPALFGGTGEDWAGPGTGVAGEALAHKIAVIDGRWRATRDAIAARDPLTLLAAVGGEEFAAIAGAILAARMGRIPVLLDGYACTAAAAVLQPPTAARSIIAWSPIARPSPAIAACSTRSASGRCSISTCGWARPRAPRSPCRSSRPPPPATTAWRPSPRPASAERRDAGGAYQRGGGKSGLGGFSSIAGRDGRCAAVLSGSHRTAPLPHLLPTPFPGLPQWTRSAPLRDRASRAEGPARQVQDGLDHLPEPTAIVTGHRLRRAVLPGVKVSGVCPTRWPDTAVDTASEVTGAEDNDLTPPHRRGSFHNPVSSGQVGSNGPGLSSGIPNLCVLPCSSNSLCAKDECAPGSRAAGRCWPRFLALRNAGVGALDSQWRPSIRRARPYGDSHLEPGSACRNHDFRTVAVPPFLKGRFGHPAYAKDTFIIAPLSSRV